MRQMWTSLQPSVPAQAVTARGRVMSAFADATGGLGSGAEHRRSNAGVVSRTNSPADGSDGMTMM
jgi:hypothetical protein